MMRRLSTSRSSLAFAREDCPSCRHSSWHSGTWGPPKLGVGAPATVQPGQGIPLNRNETDRLRLGPRLIPHPTVAFLGNKRAECAGVQWTADGRYDGGLGDAGNKKCRKQQWHREGQSRRKKLELDGSAEMGIRAHKTDFCQGRVRGSFKPKLVGGRRFTMLPVAAG